MQATNEQLEILNFVKESNEDLKISAFAGAGKTSTLRLIAKDLYHLSFLYLAFNKDIKEEAQESFSDNVHCMTYHAIARRAMQIDQSQYKQKLNLRIKNSELIKKLKLDSQDFCNPYTIIPVIKKTLSNFKISNLQKFNNVHIDVDSIMQITAIPTEQQRIASFIVKMAKKMWDLETDPDNDFPMDHDSYLKMWQLSEPKIDVDIILFDEAQDANPVVLNIIQMQNCRKIFVGDTHQKIYSWRGAVNAMETLKVKELSLTQSFRFGEEIAAFANKILNKKGEKRKLVGFNKILSRIGNIDEANKFTHLCRTNSEIIMQAILYAKSGKKIFIMGGDADIIKRCHLAYLLFSGNKSSIPQSEFSNFKTWDDFVAYAKRNRENNILVKIVQKFGNELPKLLEQLNKSQTTEEHCNIILCSAHKSKGLQWAQVKIGNDFNFKTEEEQNLFYVACTRATHTLDLTLCELTKELKP